MTVKELKEILNKCPDDTEIIINVYDAGLDETINCIYKKCKHPYKFYKHEGKEIKILELDTCYSKFYKGEE